MAGEGPRDGSGGSSVDSGTGFFTRLAPILRVTDVDAERRFYEALGLRVTYEGPEHPDFIAMGADGVEFGLELSANLDASAPPQVLTWQLVVADVDEAVHRCQGAGLRFEVTEHQPSADWRYRTVELRSPNGYRVVLEGPTE
jgi:catechol 2,3-dioxygenase-like lactoylglutathione lyase family enzyme